MARWGKQLRKLLLTADGSIVAKVEKGNDWNPNDWGADIVFESTSPLKRC